MFIYAHVFIREGVGTGVLKVKMLPAIEAVTFFTLHLHSGEFTTRLSRLKPSAAYSRGGKFGFLFYLTETKKNLGTRRK